MVYLVTGLLQIFHRMCRWKKIWKSVNILRRYGQKLVAYFLGHCVLYSIHATESRSLLL